jgi:hypothetical protein
MMLSGKKLHFWLVQHAAAVAAPIPIRGHFSWEPASSSSRPFNPIAVDLKEADPG